MKWSKFLTNTSSLYDALMDMDREISQIHSAPVISPLSGEIQELETEISNIPNAILSDSSSHIHYGALAHFMSYICVVVCFSFGIFSILWIDARTYGCMIDGQLINEIYLIDRMRKCNLMWTRSTGEVESLCCNAIKISSNIDGNTALGAVYILYAFFLLAIENERFGFGLKYPRNSFSFYYRISPCAIANTIVAFYGMTGYATALPALCLLSLAVIQAFAVYKRECNHIGDGLKNVDTTTVWLISSFGKGSAKSPSVFAITTVIAVNIVYFGAITGGWYSTVHDVYYDLFHGTLPVACQRDGCDLNRKYLFYGPPSRLLPWAKGAGYCLNMNCAIILMLSASSVHRALREYLILLAEKYSQRNGPLAPKSMGKVALFHCIRLLEPHVLRDLHYVISVLIALLSCVHIVCHYLNLVYADLAALAAFRRFRWDGFVFFSGSVMVWALLFVYSGSIRIVAKRSHDIFFGTHLFYCLFYFFLFLHSADFIYWSIPAILIWTVEIYFRYSGRDRVEVRVQSVQWVEPYLELRLCSPSPNWKFKVGQYVRINSAAISKREWHSIPLSSAPEALVGGSVPLTLLSGDKAVTTADLESVTSPGHTDEREGFFSLHVKVDNEDPFAWGSRLYKILSSNGFRLQPSFLVDGPLTPACFHDTRSVLLMHASYLQSPSSMLLIGADRGLSSCASAISSIVQFQWQRHGASSTCMSSLRFVWILKAAALSESRWFVAFLAHITTVMGDMNKNSLAAAAGSTESKRHLSIRIVFTDLPVEGSVGLAVKGRDAEAASLNAEAFCDVTTGELYSALERFCASRRLVVAGNDNSDSVGGATHVDDLKDSHPRGSYSYLNTRSAFPFISIERQVPDWCEEIKALYTRESETTMPGVSGGEASVPSQSSSLLVSLFGVCADEQERLRRAGELSRLPKECIVCSEEI